MGSRNSATEITPLLVRGGARAVQVSVRTPPLILQREYLGIPLTVLRPRRRPPSRPARRRRRSGAPAPRPRRSSSLRLPPSPRGLSEMRRPYWSPPLDIGFVSAVKEGETAVVAEVEPSRERRCS